MAIFNSGNMTNDSAAKLVSFILNNTSLSKDEKARAIVLSMSDADRTNLKNWHDLFCDKNHDDENDGNYCDFYGEDVVADAWAQPDHQSVIESALNSCTSFNAIQSCMSDIRKIGQIFNSLPSIELKKQVINLLHTGL